MNAPHNSAQARAWRKRTAAVFAAVGALIFSSGIVMLSAPAANAAGNIGVCHRTGGDHHPYVFQKVAANSTALQAHRDHQTDDDTGQDKHWKSGGVWHGATHNAGDFKPDYIQGDTGVPTDIDEFRTWCLEGLDSGGGDEDPTMLPLATPDFEANRACAVEGWIAEPASPGVQYTIDGGEGWDSVTAGDHTVTATLTNPTSTTFESPLPSGWVAGAAGTATYLVQLGAVTNPCTTGTLAVLDWAAVGDCGTYGRIARPNNTADVTYQIDGGSNWAVTTGSHVITAALAGTATAFATPYGAWAVSGTTATQTVILGSFIACTNTGGGGGGGDDNPGGNPGGGNPGGGNPGTPNPQPILVAPKYPSATDADCAHHGQLVVPAQSEGVVLSRSGSIPGDVTFTFAPAAGYVFPAGTDTEVTVTVDKRLSGEDCLLGEETTSPKPHTTKPKPKPRDQAPIVLGTQAAVPTAVDAGLAGLPSTSVSPISSPRLAQALVAGGLLLLIAGGSMGLGRRTRGAHES